MWAHENTPGVFLPGVGEGGLESGYVCVGAVDDDVEVFEVCYPFS